LWKRVFPIAYFTFSQVARRQMIMNKRKGGLCRLTLPHVNSDHLNNSYM
jgi:hypothetical protein